MAGRLEDPFVVKIFCTYAHRSGSISLALDLSKNVKGTGTATVGAYWQPHPTAPEPCEYVFSYAYARFGVNATYTFSLPSIPIVVLGVPNWRRQD